MSEMTRERWLQIDGLQWDKIRKEFPTGNMRRLRRKLTKSMIATHGPCPSGPPLKVRLGLWWARKQLEGMRPTEVSMFWRKIIVSAGAALAAGVAAAQPALSDGITGQEWGAIITAGVIAGYGAFKSNTTWIAPARKGETVRKFGAGAGA